MKMKTKVQPEINYCSIPNIYGRIATKLKLKVNHREKTKNKNKIIRMNPQKWGTYIFGQ